MYDKGFVRLVKEVTDLSGDNPDFKVPFGAVCEVIRDDEDGIEVDWLGKQFPLTDDEFIRVVTAEEVQEFDQKAEQYTAAHIAKYPYIDQAVANAIHTSHLAFLINDRISNFKGWAL